MALSSFFLLAACTSTTTIVAADSDPTPQSSSTSDASTNDDAPTSTEDGSENTDPVSGIDDDDSTDDSAATEAPASGADDARFVLQGELPLSTAEVNGLISFIEDDTGRPFLRPPVIVAQTRDEFTAGLTADVDDFDDTAELTVRELQALGLTTSGVAEVTDAYKGLLLSPEGVLGYYDPEADELYVPIDSPGDDQFRGLLVHELTHALDGQYADLNVLEAMFEVAEETGDYEPITTLRAVIEGRASSVQNRWNAANDVEPELPDDLGALNDVPPAMVLELSVPYAFGEQFIEFSGGAANTWEAVENPPVSSEQFIVPGTSADEAIVSVPTPVADGPILKEKVYGASDIFVWLLGESLTPEQALIFPTIIAVDGWAGGRSVLWGDETESCVRIALAADSADDLSEIQDAIALWADGGPDRLVEVDGDLVVVTGCAPYVP